MLLIVIHGATSDIAIFQQLSVCINEQRQIIFVWPLNLETPMLTKIAVQLDED